MLTKEQEEQVKKQLIQQVESTFPEDQKEAAKKQILSMSNEELESFVKRNASGEGSCIFCSIASGESESYKIAENDSAVAVLEINPISKGHVIVIPKAHISYKESPELMGFANQVALAIKKKLSPKDVEISSVDFRGHGVINLVPVYSDENASSERRRASREELEEILSRFKNSDEEPKVEKRKSGKRKYTRRTVPKPRKKKIDSKNIWLPKRIP